MKTTLTALLCIAVITLSCNATIEESEITNIVDESTRSEQKFRVCLSNGEICWVQHTRENYKCQHMTYEQRGPIVMPLATEKSPEESKTLFLLIQGLHAKQRQAKAPSKAPWWQWCSVL